MIEGEVPEINVGHLSGSQTLPKCLQRHQDNLDDLVAVGLWFALLNAIAGDDNVSARGG